MRFMITAAPDPEKAPSNTFPDEKTMAAYMAFNERLFKAGVLVVSEGLSPNGQGACIGNVGGKRVLLDGPFAESKELVGGFYLIDVPSREEAIRWALECPTGLGSDDLLTIHPMTEAADIPPEMMKIIRESAPTWSASFEKNRK